MHYNCSTLFCTYPAQEFPCPTPPRWPSGWTVNSSKKPRRFRTLGLSTSQAIKLFLTQVRLRHEIPFALELPERIPNAETVAAFEETDLERFETPEELFKDLGI